MEFEVIYKGDKPDMADLGIPGLDDDNFQLDVAFIDIDEIVSVHKTRPSPHKPLKDPCVTLKNGDSFTLTMPYDELKMILQQRVKEIQRTFI